MPTNYHQCYETLSLEHDADWDTAKTNYRHLVLEWHPDRHTASQAENESAQSRFIELNKAYQLLRRYYRRHQRMPLLDSTAGKAAGLTRSESLRKRALEREQVHRQHRRNRLGKLAIASLAAAFCVALLLFLFTLDRRLKVQAHEEAKVELDNAEQSRFLRSHSEISRTQAKEAFILYDPAGGALGQDTGQLFRQD